MKLKGTPLLFDRDFARGKKRECILVDMSPWPGIVFDVYLIIEINKFSSAEGSCSFRIH
ncbi:hypothetical protein U8P75_11885 [Rhizobium beringeri]|nr:hypothetical protein U8P75_11885 [Rhizobium beringeri]